VSWLNPVISLHKKEEKKKNINFSLDFIKYKEIAVNCTCPSNKLSNSSSLQPQHSSLFPSTSSLVNVRSFASVLIIIPPLCPVHRVNDMFNYLSFFLSFFLSFTFLRTNLICSTSVVLIPSVYPGLIIIIFFFLFFVFIFNSWLTHFGVFSSFFFY